MWLVGRTSSAVCYACGVTTTDRECLSGRNVYDSRVRELVCAVDAPIRASSRYALAAARLPPKPCSRCALRVAGGSTRPCISLPQLASSRQGMRVDGQVELPQEVTRPAHGNGDREYSKVGIFERVLAYADEYPVEVCAASGEGLCVGVNVAAVDPRAAVATSARSYAHVSRVDAGRPQRFQGETPRDHAHRRGNPTDLATFEGAEFQTMVADATYLYLAVGMQYEGAVLRIRL